MANNNGEQYTTLEGAEIDKGHGVNGRLANVRVGSESVLRWHRAELPFLPRKRT